MVHSSQKAFGDSAAKTKGGANDAIRLLLGQLVVPLGNTGPSHSQRARKGRLRAAEKVAGFLFGHGAMLTHVSARVSTSVIPPVFTLENMGGFADRVAAAIQEAAITQSELAKLAGMTRANITHWINGRARNPHADQILRAAAALKVNALWLATGAGPKRGPEPPAGFTPRPDQMALLEDWEWLLPEQKEQLRADIAKLAKANADAAEVFASRVTAAKAATDGYVKQKLPPVPKSASTTSTRRAKPK